MVNSDDSNLVADANPGLVNYPIACLFQVDNLISSSTNTYTYRAMLEVPLGYDQGANNSYLTTMGLYCKDTETEMGLATVDGANSGLKARTQYIKESKLVEVSGLLYYDLVNSDRLILSGLPLKIVLHRQRDSFVLMADNTSRDCRVCIIETQLCVQHVKMSD